MKRTVIFFLLILLTILLTSEARALVTFGLKGGLNSSKVSFSPGIDDFFNQKRLQGISFGAFLSINLGPVGFQPELLYSRRGLEYQFIPDPASPGVTAEARLALDYIEIPLLVRLNIIPIGPVKLYLFGGPSYGYLQRAKTRISVSGTEHTEDVKQDFNKSALAAVGGLGLDLKLPLLPKITADVRFHYGLTNILSGDSTLLDLTDKARNTGFSFMVGMAF